MDVGRPFNIFQTPGQESNRVLDAVLEKNKSDGFEKRVEHKLTIKKENLNRLDGYFSDVLTEGDAGKLSHR